MNKRDLKCHADSTDFLRKLSLRFTPPDETLDSHPTEQPDCRLLQIPYELQMLIYETIDDAPSQIAVALTCRQMAQVAAHTDLSRSYTSAKYAGQIPKEVFDVPTLMPQLSSWMPAHLRLCNHCLTYRPCDADYWATVKGCENATFWIRKTGWERAGASWARTNHNICPSCHLTCGLSDFTECDGCRTLGRLGDIDWARVSGMQRRARVEIGSDNFAR